MGENSYGWVVLWRAKCFVCHSSGHRLDAVWTRPIQALLTQVGSECWLRLTYIRIVLTLLHLLWSHWPWFHWNKVSHLSVGEGRGKRFGISICLGRANKPSFTDFYTCTSAEMKLESFWRDNVPYKDQTSLFFGLSIWFSTTFPTQRSQASCRLTCSLKCSSNCPLLQERTQILRPLLQALANHGSHLMWECSDAATLLAERQHPWSAWQGRLG